MPEWLGRECSHGLVSGRPIIHFSENCMGISEFADNTLRKTLWIWLPFYALKRLLTEIFFSKKK